MTAKAQNRGETIDGTIRGAMASISSLLGVSVVGASPLGAASAPFYSRPVTSLAPW
jgi:hypothetical protein